MRKLLLILPILILSSAVNAQDAPPEPKQPEPQTSLPPSVENKTSAGTVTPVQPRTDFYLKFDASDLQILNNAIMELPKKIADPYLAKLNGQLSSQTQQANEAEAKKGGVK